ncbi:hypothetical protein AYO38_01395, partial [bacterium SCGC AG-212-C10]
IQPLPEDLNRHITIVDETTDLDAARERLRNGEVDAVAVLPTDPISTVKKGERVPLYILIDDIDPVSKSFTRAFLREQVAVLNQRTVAKAITDAQEPLAQAEQVIAQARPLVDALQKSPVSLVEAEQQLQTLRSYVGPLSRAAAAAENATRGTSFIIPGFGNPSDQAQRLNRAVQDFDATLTRIDAQIQTSRANGQLPTDADIAALDGQLSEIETSINDFGALPPEVLSAPFQLKLENISPSDASVTGFYAPAVMMLLIQHLAITLAALSMSRVRLIGLMDILRVSPVRAWEVVAGNYLSYGVLVAAVGASLFGVLVGFLDVPMEGSLLMAGAISGLLLLTSLGVGLVISMLSKDENQAAQLSMLVLLASIFFSGFVFALDRVTWPVRAISYALPSTYAIRAMQDEMLRGIVQHQEDVWILAGAAAGLFILAVLLFRREFRADRSALKGTVPEHKPGSAPRILGAPESEPVRAATPPVARPR